MDVVSVAITQPIKVRGYACCFNRNLINGPETIILKKVIEIVGGNKKIVTPLHQQKNKNTNMLRKQNHIETVRWFSPIGDYAVLRGMLCYSIR